MNENHRPVYPGDSAPGRHPGDGKLRRGDPVRALPGPRNPAQGMTGVVERAGTRTTTVRWTTGDVTVVATRTLQKITDSAGR